MSESTQTLHINGETIKLYDNVNDVGANKTTVGSLFAKMDTPENNNVNNSKTVINGKKILVRNFTTISTLPSQSGSLIYTGSSRTPLWNDYNASNLSISGTTSAVSAGSYTATFTPKYGYSWNDWSTDSKSNTWAIGKAGGICSPTSTSTSVTHSNCECNQCQQCKDCTYYECNIVQCNYYQCSFYQCTDCSYYYYYYYSCSCG